MDEISIGRASECTLVIPESFTKVSNEHADIRLENGTLVFADHSSNGTKINGKKVHHSECRIKEGDIIILGDDYDLKWIEISRFFPNLHRATERFDGSSVDVNGRKTEMFDGSQVGVVGQGTEIFDGSSSNNDDSRKTERLDSDTSKNAVRGQLNEFTQAEIEDLTEKWHFGAFLSSWVWAMANRIYWPLAIIPISFIPYVGQVASLFVCTYLGLNGYKLAWTKRTDHNFKKFVAEQKKWVALGGFFFIVFAAVQAAALYIIL